MRKCEPSWEVEGGERRAVKSIADHGEEVAGCLGQESREGIVVVVPDYLALLLAVDDSQGSARQHELVVDCAFNLQVFDWRTLLQLQGD